MRFGFIGTGRIASDLVEGLHVDAPSGEKIYLSPRNREVSARLAAIYPGVEIAPDNQAVVDLSDVVFLAVLPSAFSGAMRGLRFHPGQLLICLVAATPLDTVRALAAPAEAVRAVPQPSSRRRRSPTILYPDNPRARAVLDRIGRTIAVEDEDTFRAMEAVTGLIKPLYSVIGEVASWLERHGVPEPEATRYVLEEFQGALGLALEPDSPGLNDHSAAAATRGGLNHQATEFLREAGTFQDFAKVLDVVLARIVRQSAEVAK